MVYLTADQIDFVASDLPAMPRPGRVLMVTPDYFDVMYVINPHMEGNVGSVDTNRAADQWTMLQDAYESLGIQPVTIRGVEGLPDMVFAANQTLPFYDPESGRRGVVLSRMHASERRDEVDHFERFFRGMGQEVLRLEMETGTSFEGMGDAIWHPGRFLLWGGYGFRTGLDAYRRLSERLGVSILALRLEDPDFYHLDTCFSALDEKSVLYFPGAFQPEGLTLLQRLFERTIEAPEEEARSLFACNAHCPDGKHVLIQKGCAETNRRLREAGFVPLEVDTGEYLKSGGSVFCMKQMFW